MANNEIRISIAKEFSITPGARFRADGPYSGEEFREDFLEGPMRDTKIRKIVIVLDGTEGYATSFLEEAFGGLARLFDEARCLEKLEFISTEDPLQIEEIKGYIRDGKIK